MNNETMCPQCRGFGSVAVPIQDAGPVWAARERCPLCDGEGRCGAEAASAYRARVKQRGDGERHEPSYGGYPTINGFVGQPGWCEPGDSDTL